jgi:hypothetical protein
MATDRDGWSFARRAASIIASSFRRRNPLTQRSWKIEQRWRNQRSPVPVDQLGLAELLLEPIKPLAGAVDVAGDHPVEELGELGLAAGVSRVLLGFLGQSAGADVGDQVADGAAFLDELGEPPERQNLLVLVATVPRRRAVRDGESVPALPDPERVAAHAGEFRDRGDRVLGLGRWFRHRPQTPGRLGRPLQTQDLAALRVPRCGSHTASASSCQARCVNFKKPPATATTLRGRQDPARWPGADIRCCRFPTPPDRVKGAS